MTTFAQRQTVTYVALDAEFEQTHPNYVTNNCVYMQCTCAMYLYTTMLLNAKG